MTPTRSQKDGLSLASFFNFNLLPEEAELEIYQLMGSPDGWTPSGMPEDWTRERSASKGEPYFEDVGSLGGWDNHCYQPAFEKGINKICTHERKNFI